VCLFVLVVMTMAYAFSDYNASPSFADADILPGMQLGGVSKRPAEPISRELLICAFAVLPLAAAWERTVCVGDSATRWIMLPIFLLVVVLALLFISDGYGEGQLMSKRGDGRKIQEDSNAESSYY
jgi:hypothetical protein